MEFRRSLGVIESPELLGSSGMGSSLVLSCSFWLSVIDLDYDYWFLLEVYFELSDLYFVVWLRYHLMLALCDRSVLVMVNILALELWQLLQYSYVCSIWQLIYPTSRKIATRGSIIWYQFSRFHVRYTTIFPCSDSFCVSITYSPQKSLKKRFVFPCLITPLYHYNFSF